MSNRERIGAPAADLLLDLFSLELFAPERPTVSGYDMVELHREITTLRADLRSAIAELRGEIASVRGDLRARSHN